MNPLQLNFTQTEVSLIGLGLTAFTLILSLATAWLREKIRADIAESESRVLKAIDDKQYVETPVCVARMTAVDQRCAVRCEARQTA